ncbi:adenosylcobinamide-GDP ribazoletransferase [Robertmurraya korlensis]|uniref:adenosylcobinamide-GDP ribazoletransferase n=1 Tax=Robertmurraya korlensis TaxID=519977 RepID=UPI00203D35FD|nr:adenosylcobinamide-GDP ribazoletransferase [Robertmurraya korlensis]MCM3603255.1 adenosylcobinamide-GDP ribazoletransferase [Robertmurraya korlensis]
MKMVRAFLLNLQFFTSIPVKMNLPMDAAHMKRAVGMFPLLGILQGTMYSVLLFTLIEWTPLSTVSIAFILWLAWIFFTGGLHLDGWMDASDAFFSYRDKEKRLEIMSDPRTGAFGVLSAIVLLSGRYLFLYEIIQFVHTYTYIVILFIPFFSRGVIGALLVLAPLAKNEGLAAFFRERLSKISLLSYPFYCMVVLIGLTLFIPALTPMFLLLLASAFLCFLFIQKKSVHWFGGITGDVLGASAEGTEWLLWMIVWLWHYAGMA